MIHREHLQARSYSGVWTIICLLAALPAFTNVKLGSLQPEDFVLLVLVGICIADFLYSGLSFRLLPELKDLSKSYGLLVVSLFLLTILDLRMKFYPLENASLLKQPLILPFIRLLQFASMLYGFLWLTRVFITKKGLLAQAMNVYWRIGIMSSLYATLSCFAVKALHVTPSPDSIFGAYLPDGQMRARGFFVEGGPFGLYLVSVLVVGLLRRYMTGRRLGMGNMVILFVAFFLSGSKAGFLAGTLLTIYSGISAASFHRKVLYLLLVTSILAGAAVWMNLGDSLLGYATSIQNVELNADMVGNDPNIVLGRIAALYIVPRMIAAHPVTGIGIGNYPLVRNDPDYLGQLPAITDLEDQPGLGIPGIAAEFGIPATLWLLVLLFRPYWQGRKKASILVISALFQPLAHAVGVQLTFFYPWFVSACALAASIGEERQTAARSADLDHLEAGVIR